MPNSAERDERDRRLSDQEKRLDKIAANYERLAAELDQLESHLESQSEFKSDAQALTQEKPK